MLPFRTGLGYDVHQLVENRPLILGGVLIESPLGLKGHSDADVLTHAIMDGLLGALALGDLGKHFPDTDPAYKNISSLELLKEVLKKVHQKGYCIGNIDAIIVAQVPKCAPYIKGMRHTLAKTLHIHEDQISVKATTEEHLGFTGRKEGIAAYANVLLMENNHKIT